MQTKQHTQLIFAFVTICGLLVGLSWIWGHSYIYLENNNTARRTYKIINDAGISTSFVSSERVVKRLVKKGTYQVVVQQDAKNFFAIRKAGGFLVSSRISVGLINEKERAFVGNNPAPCAHYLGDALFSTECGGSAYRIEKHLASSGYTPSYRALLPSNNLFGELGGIATTTSGDYLALLKDVEGVAGYSLQKISSELVGGVRTRIDTLDPNYEYSILPYLSGVLVYQESIGQYLYIDPTNMSTTPIRIDSPKSSGLSFTSLRTAEDNIVVMYSDGSATENLNPEEDSLPKSELVGKSEAIIYTKNGQKHILLQNIYSSAVVCGKQRLCAIGLLGMSVYDISKQNPVKLYTIPGITDVFETSSSKILLVSSLGIMSYDPSTDSGSYDYTFGEYRVCGFSPAANDEYLLCLINNRQEKVGLVVYPKQTKERTPIDKAVLNILKSNAVSSVSAYRNIIIVTPRFYDEASGVLFGRDKVKYGMQRAIERADIPAGYSVINTSNL